MARGSILQMSKVVLLDNPLASGSTTNDRGSKVVDMQGYDSITTFTTLGATSTLTTVTAQMAASTSAADFANITHNSSAITAASTATNGLLVLEVSGITKRYFRLTVNSTGSNLYGGTVAVLRRAHSAPSTNASTDVFASSVGVST